MSSYMTSEQMDRLVMAVWARDGGCVLAGDGDCSQKRDAHHMIKQQRLDKLIPKEILETVLCDQRGAVALCSRHHACVHASTHRIPATVLMQTEFYLPGEEEPDEPTFTRDYDLRAIWEGIVAKQLPTHRRLDI